MKHHLNIIILALRLLIAATAISAFYQAGMAVLFLVQDNPEMVKDFFSDYFTPLAKNMPYFNNKWYGSAFCLLYSGLLIYVTLGIRRLYKCLKKIKKGQLFYNTQGEELRKVGSTVIIFAKSEYLLFCIMAGLYFDLTVFFWQLPSFLAIYLMGKFILLLSHMAEKGEYIQQENELTI